jgi:hypothetical protein
LTPQLDGETLRRVGAQRKLDPLPRRLGVGLRR